jgi:hypothetical protein
MARAVAPELPWGGNVKESGVGKEGSMCGLEEAHAADRSSK